MSSGVFPLMSGASTFTPWSNRNFRILVKKEKKKNILVREEKKKTILAREEKKKISGAPLTERKTGKKCRDQDSNLGYCGHNAMS